MAQPYEAEVMCCTATSMAVVHVVRAQILRLRSHMWSTAACKIRNLPQVLDVGCGQGTHTIFLGSKGLQATGVDLSPDAIAEAGERLSAAGTRLHAPACRLTLLGGTAFAERQGVLV